jgi:hypothetical protein
MTPSTETCAVVVSFMVAIPFSLGFVGIRKVGGGTDEPPHPRPTL